MNEENPDLSPGMAESLRSVARVDSATKESHIAAALDAMDSPAPVRTPVVTVDFRRRVLASAAAVLLVGLAYAAGWSTRGREPAPTAATVRDTAAAPANSDEVVPQASVPKGVTPAASPVCKDGTVPQTIDSVFIGDYTNPADGHVYLVYTFSGTVEFIDKDTCQSAQLITDTTAP